MKYTLSVRQPADILAQADEIKLPYKDIDILTNYIERFPKATFIVDLTSSDEPDWKLMCALSETSSGRLLFAVDDVSISADIRNLGLSFYWKYPCNSYYEASALAALSPSYLVITAPLTHDLPHVSKFGIPLRMTPNVAYSSYLPHETGLQGQFIRPEDLTLYSEYISAIEFAAPDLIKERTLFKIYKSGTWKGNLAFVVTNLGFSIDNRMIPPEFGQKRISCRQVCQIPGHSCHYCDSLLEIIACGEDLARSREKIDNITNI